MPASAFSLRVCRTILSIKFISLADRESARKPTKMLVFICLLAAFVSEITAHSNYIGGSIFKVLLKVFPDEKPSATCLLSISK
jgi:dolichol kinase